VWQEFLERRSHMGYSPEAALAARSETLGAKIASGDTTGLRGAVGTPDQVREYLRRFEEAGVDQIIFVLQAGRNRHEHIMESLELFGTQILPEFAERDEAHAAERERRFAPHIEAAFARKAGLGLDQVPTMPDDYEMKAIPKAMIDMAQNEAGQQLLERIADEGAVGDTTTMTSILGSGG
jgi:hypothetical protein